MDLLSKGYKFLSELDDPSQAEASDSLESSLDGVAEKWLGWTRPGSTELPKELTTISQSTGEEVSEDLPKEALKWQDAEPEPAEPAVFEPPAVEPAVEEVAVIPEPASPEPAAAAEAVAVPEPPVEEALHLEAEPPEAPGEAPNAVDEEPEAAPAAPLEPFEEAPAAPGAEGLPEPNPFGEDAQRLREDLAEAQGLLKQRERQLADLSNALAEKEASDAVRREQHQATKTKALEAIRQAEGLKTQWKAKVEQLEAANQELKERAAVEVRRLKQEARDMENELHKAQEVWREKIRKAEARALELEKEGKEAASSSTAELTKLKARLRAQAAGSEETRGELEAYKARAEDEMGRLNERMRGMADSELRLRHELQDAERGRQELQERVVELSGQLEHAQQTYSEAAREVGQMSLRLNELEFGQKADSHSEDLLREELAATRERLSSLEELHKECVWMRDHALQQAEEARGKLQAAEEQHELFRAQMEGAAASPEAETAREEVADLRQQLQKLLEQHQSELQQQAAMSMEEIEYLKRKNDEKEKRLEILTCERNALRYESTEAAKPGKVAPALREGGDKLVDLEDGLSLKELAQQQGAVKAFLTDGDLVLKRFSKLLFASPTTRRLFYGYILLLHIWIWVVLHRAAAVHSSHTIAKPIAPG